MSLHILLENQPEFYTNLDDIVGRIILTVTRPEVIGAISVKLEGEAKTTEPLDELAANHGAFAMPGAWPSSSSSSHSRAASSPSASTPSLRIGGRSAPSLSEDHKILYKVATLFPGTVPTTMAGSIDSGGSSSSSSSYVFQPGRYEWQFRFKLPVNNVCGNRQDMARIGGIMGTGGYTAVGQSLLGGLVGAGIGSGASSVRVMDGTKQLWFQHVTQTLPPSLTGLRRADIRYYIKSTVTRTGFLKDNWRQTLGFKFMPIEPPRPQRTTQEKFARRPFAFSPVREMDKKSLFEGFKGRNVPMDGPQGPPPPTVMVSARLPHPPVLTCNQPIPLRLIVTKKTPTPADVYLISLQVELKGITNVRCFQQRNQETQTWVVISHNNLCIPLTKSTDAPPDTDVEISDRFWRDTLLPSSITPSFASCNIARTYDLEVKLGISWGTPRKTTGSSKPPIQTIQTIFLPLTFKEIPVYSGIAPPPSLAHAQTAPVQPGPTPAGSTLRPPEKPIRRRPTSPGPGFSSGSNGRVPAPPLPPRQQRAQSVPVTPTMAGSSSQAQMPFGQYSGGAPPQPQQSQPGPEEPLYDDPPPSYDEAMAETLAGPFDGMQHGSRPAFSGVTDENVGISNDTGTPPSKR